MNELDKLNETDRNLFLVFRKAVEAEKEAQSMYQEMLELSDDSAFRETILGFIRDEERHEKEIVDRYRVFREKLGLSDHS